MKVPVVSYFFSKSKPPIGLKISESLTYNMSNLYMIKTKRDSCEADLDLGFFEICQDLLDKSSVLQGLDGAQAADGDGRKVNLFNGHGCGSNAGQDRILLPLIVGMDNEDDTYDKEGNADNGPEESGVPSTDPLKDIVDAMHGGVLGVVDQTLLGLIPGIVVIIFPVVVVSQVGRSLVDRCLGHHRVARRRSLAGVHALDVDKGHESVCVSVNPDRAGA